MTTKRPRHELALDLLLAGFVLLAELPFHIDPQPFGPQSWLAWPALALGLAAIIVRRTRPALALGLVAASAALQMAGLWPPVSMNLAQLIVVFSCAAGPSRRLRRIAFAAAVGGAIVGGAYTALYVHLAGGGQAEPYRILLVGGIAGGIYLLVLVLAWALGYARHLVLRSRAAQVARQIAEIEGGHARELVASERERGRIAREMHDVLAHSLVVIATLSDGARLAVDREPEEAKGAVRTIGEVSRDALADVRRLLAELRHEQEAGPTADFAERGELVERFEALGLVIRREVEGAERPLTPGASLAAYRIVQEGLTNALRHGDAKRPVELRERWSDDGLELSIRNSCRPDGEPTLPSGGHGLSGLRERALLEAGRLSAGRAGDEFRLEAALPVGQAERLGAAIQAPAGRGATPPTAGAPDGGPAPDDPARPSTHPGPAPRPGHELYEAGR